MEEEQEKSVTEKLGYYVAPTMYKQLMRGRKKVLDGNLDRIYVIDGREGEAGKSTLALQLANAVDPNFNLKKVVFKSKAFEEMLRSAEKGSAIVFDEAFNGLSSKGALSKENKRLVRLLMEVRQRNLFIFIVLPSIFLLEKYVAIFRSHALLHGYSSRRNAKRRYYKIYNYKMKKMLYISGKAHMSYRFPKVRKSYAFYGKFPPTINQEEYIKKKLQAFRDNETEQEPEETQRLMQRNLAWYFMNKKYKIKQTEIINLYKQVGTTLPKMTISNAISTVPKKYQIPSTLL